MEWIIAIIAIIVILLIIFVLMYNGLVKAKLKVENAWSTIDTQLLRRFDLIPNLVETVKGYAKHEEGTFAEVVKYRNQYADAKTMDEKVASADKFETCLKSLFALSEAYPQLMANTQFLNLQTQLSELESKIALARQVYNDTVLMYNKSVMSFPQNIVASMFNFTILKFFEVTAEQKENVQVKF